MIHLRRAAQSDIASIFKWRNHPDVRKMMFDSSELDWDKHVRYWQQLLQNELSLCFIIIDDDQDCGVIRLDLTENKTIGIVDIFIDPKAHGKGIGTKAMKALVDRLNDSKIDKLVAQVIPENISSRRMFEKSGFEIVFTQLEYKLS